MTYTNLKNQLRMDDIAYDPWGTAMGWLFAVCDCLTFERDTDCPEHWDFRPSPLGMDESRDELGDLRECETADILRFGELLYRFVKACQHAGKDY